MIPQKATYAIAKAIHHVNAASFYFGLTITESKAIGKAKDILNGYVMKMEWVNKDILSKISTDEAKNALKTELKDPLWLDCMCDSLITLTAENREKIEAEINRLITLQSISK